ncbi:C39 family peptidase [Paenibacillus sp. 481]|nr:C39 family peptidase [Paenibacillus sp. 481]
MVRFVKRLNRWLLICIFVSLCAYPIKILASKIDKNTLSLAFGLPSDDIVVMMYSNTAKAGRYLIPIDEGRPHATPYTNGGETLVPARFLASQLDAELTINEKQGTLTLTGGRSSVTYQLNKAAAKIDGKPTKLHAPAQIKEGLAYVPLRAAGQAFGRNMHAQDGLVALTRNVEPPDSEQWQDWREQLVAYIAYDTVGSYTVEFRGSIVAIYRRWEDAIGAARQVPGRIVKYRGQHALWDPQRPAPKSFRVNEAPLIMQLPELPRGCEVTSLAMLLHSAGIEADKMELAREIRKNTAPYIRVGNEIHFGNPNNGFVGDMYSFDKPGLGVYHDPIAELAEKYMPGRIMDITGTSFEHLLGTVAQGTPVWVIHTTLYDAVPANAWQTWQTEDGPIQVTYYEHSLLVTGYDEKYVYVNDPLGRRNKVERAAFKRGWVQMGSQAVTYSPNE